MEKDFGKFEEWVRFITWAQNKKLAEKNPKAITGIVTKEVHYNGEVCNVVTVLSLEDIERYQNHALACYA